MAGVAERRAGTNGDLALSQAGDDVGLLGVAEVDPGEVGLGLGGRKAELAQAFLDPEALGDRALDPRRHVVLVQDRLGPRGLGEGVDAEGLTHSVDRGAELG